MSIYTRTGDKGKTILGNRQRVSKASRRIRALGSLDELNSFLGFSINFVKAEKSKNVLRKIQQRIFALGAAVGLAAKTSYRPIGQKDILDLEKEIDRLEKGLPKLRHFILPNGAIAGSILHVCRAVCRRAEVNITQVNKASKPSRERSASTAFLNRLSDFLFVLARFENRKSGRREVIWKPPQKNP